MTTTATAPAYRPLPQLAPRAQDEAEDTYSLRVLRFMLDCRNVPGCLTDHDLELADKAAQRYATQAQGPDGLASKLEPHQLAIVRTFSEARHWIAASQDQRRRWAQETAQAAQETPAPTGGRQPGRPAPLAPTPPGKGPGSHADTSRNADLVQAETAWRQNTPTRTPADGIRF
jgi:hypothetical protein